jgi:hypothetical protein
MDDERLITLLYNCLILLQEQLNYDHDADFINYLQHETDIQHWELSWLGVIK